MARGKTGLTWGRKEGGVIGETYIINNILLSSCGHRRNTTLARDARFAGHIPPGLAGGTLTYTQLTPTPTVCVVGIIITFSQKGKWWGTDTAFLLKNNVRALVKLMKCTLGYLQMA
ncbi:hypothetical protein Bbelb_408110 [Branchiostoma belcheri]|nr:hypothetical protein Bbelb_408110 [Branchiostoma belcheri]